MYWAELGHGAWLIERDDSEHEITLTADSTPQPGTPLAGKLIDVSIRGFGIDAELQLLRHIRNERGVYRSSGSAGLMLAHVADRGRDAAVITAAPYDLAAGTLITTEAGGRVASAGFERDGHEFTVLVAASDAEVGRTLEDAAAEALEPHSLTPWSK